MSIRMGRSAVSVRRAIYIVTTHILLQHAVWANTPGKVDLFDDWNCQTQSSLNPTVSVPVDTCLVTANGGGLIIALNPPCPHTSDGNGSATHIFYSDAVCGSQTENAGLALGSTSCYQIAAGIDIYNAESFMFSCQPADQDPSPTSTTTAVVSGIAAATGTSDSDSNGSVPSAAATSAAATTGFSNGGLGESPSASASKGPTSSTAVAHSQTTGTFASPTAHPSGSALDTSDIVAIAVGLGVGIPTLLLMLAAWLLPNFRYTLVRWFSSGHGLRTVPSQETRQLGGWENQGYYR